MDIKPFTEIRSVAAEKWREYKEAEKMQPANPLYKDLKKLYHQIKTGKKIIDIHKVIQTGGVHGNFHPKLAIAKAKTKKIFCRYHASGNVEYKNERFGNFKVSDVVLKLCLPIIPEGTFKNRWESSFELEAPVPLIPPKYLPKNLTDDYYILWEVDVWKMVPPTDPYLLKRITKNHFVVLEGWDLTELEKSVMATNL